MDSIIVEMTAQEVASVTLNRPHRLNAFDDEMIAQLQQSLDELSVNDGVKVLLLRANGKSFSAGADLNWMHRMGAFTREQNIADARLLARLMQTLNTFNKPTIAVVQGAAFGGAVGLIACCDIALATPQAKFSLSEVRLGLIPAVISPYVIAAIGQRQARRYFQTAEIFDAQRAKSIGLLHEVVDEAQLDDVLQQLLIDLRQAAPQALSEVKKLMATVAAVPVTDDLIEYTVQAIAERRSSAEARQGLDAFLNKQKPDWLKDND